MGLVRPPDPDLNPPVNRWAHFAYQLKGSGPISEAAIFDGMVSAGEGGSGSLPKSS